MTAQVREAGRPDQLDELVARTVAAIRHETRARGRRVGYAWSGGKDSQVLAWLMTRAGVHHSVLAVTTGLEFPAMRAWHAEHQPSGCTVIAQPLDLGWLADHPKMLFPQRHYGVAWVSLVSRRAQAIFFHREALDLLAVGTRRAQRQYVGSAGCRDRYLNAAGVTRWSPIADWTDAQIEALIAREKLAVAPFYGWPRGAAVGPVPWPARQHTRSLEHGFDECWAIDAQVVRDAAQVIPAAAAWMNLQGVR